MENIHSDALKAKSTLKILEIMLAHEDFLEGLQLAAIHCVNAAYSSAQDNRVVDFLELLPAWMWADTREWLRKLGIEAKLVKHAPVLWTAQVVDRKQFSAMQKMAVASPLTSTTKSGRPKKPWTHWLSTETAQRHINGIAAIGVRRAYNSKNLSLLKNLLKQTPASFQPALKDWIQRAGITCIKFDNPEFWSLSVLDPRHQEKAFKFIRTEPLKLGEGMVVEDVQERSRGGEMFG